MTSMFDQDLPQTAANFAAMSPLTFIERTAQVYPDRLAVVHGLGPQAVRQTWGVTYDRCRQLASALVLAGVGKNDTVAVMLPNTPPMVEAHFGIPMAGAVLNALNTRLDPETVAFMLDHGEAKVVIVDPEFSGTLHKALALRQSTRPLLVIDVIDPLYTGPSERQGQIDYEAFLAQGDPQFAWQLPDNEWDAIALNYTSGTTGNPKAALYSHRSTMLHAYACALPDVMCLSARDSILPVVPMFHVNAWGIPYSAAMVGAKLVFPGAALDGKSVYELLESEKVTLAAGVPTVWQMLLGHLKAGGLRFKHLKRTVIGGSACPPAMIQAFNDEYGVEVLHAWGMTELSPLGTLCTLKNKHMELPAQEQMKIRLKQGRAIFGVDFKIVDDLGNEQPNDGKAYGDLLVKGPWVIREYFKQEGSSPLVDGWFPTGDVATVDPDGFLQITDRSKDVIKSGGEWISSIDVENIAMAHPDVAMAACIGMPHPKWDERPIVVVVKKPGTPVARDELLKFYEGKIAKWQIPDDVVFVDAIPLGATGKMLKTKLREQLAGYKLPA